MASTKSFINIWWNFIQDPLNSQARCLFKINTFTYNDIITKSHVPSAMITWMLPYMTPKFANYLQLAVLAMHLSNWCLNWVIPKCIYGFLPGCSKKHKLGNWTLTSTHPQSNTGHVIFNVKERGEIIYFLHGDIQRLFGQHPPPTRTGLLTSERHLILIFFQSHMIICVLSLLQQHELCKVLLLAP